MVAMVDALGTRATSGPLQGPSRAGVQPTPIRRACVAVGFLALVVYTAWQGQRAGSAPLDPSASGLRFREVSREVGIEFRHEATSIDPRLSNLTPHITGVGAAVSIADVDGDRLPDLFALTSADGGRNGLYRNRGDGTFEDVAERAGLANLNRSGESCAMGSVWGDYDNDGDEDVFLYAWGRCRLFRNDGGLRFVEVTAGSGLEAWINSNAATWLDFDRDGVLDLYVTGYFGEQHGLWRVETTRVMHGSFEFADNGGRNRLYRGRGDGTFEDVTDVSGADSTRWTYAAIAADFDQDGWVDLYLANDYGSEQLLLNRNGERFEEATGIGLESESKSGMSATLGDPLGQGRLCVFVTNISKQGYLFQGNNLRASYVERGGRMVQLAEGAVADCGWAWGSQFGDLDNDGRDDLVVVNGFVSASRERDYWYQLSKISIATGDVLADAARWPPMEDRSLSGYERTRVLLNLGLRGAYFREVGEQVGIDDVYDGRAVALGDLFGSGRLDVVTANQRGPLLVYRNISANDHHWIGFDLVGTRSNRSALGAEVRLRDGDREQVRVVLSASGFSSQNDHRLHFGLGAEPGAPQATIRWPSGTVQELGALELDRMHLVTEPE